jgi:hypothetical protein
MGFADLTDAAKNQNQNNKTTTAKKLNVELNPMASDFAPSFAAPPKREILAAPQGVAAALTPQKEWSIKGAAQAKDLQENRTATL